MEHGSTQMVDWITAQVACDYDGEITGGRVLYIDPDGSIDWAKDRWHEVTGSHSSKMMVQGLDDGTIGCRLYISGNPAKFLQGHNLFGSDDVKLLVSATMTRICEQLGLHPSDNERWSWSAGLFLLSRVDINRMYDLGAPERVQDWLAGAAQVVHSRYQSAGNDHGSTLYVGKKSRRASLKIYDKLAELQVRGHGLADTLPVDWYHRLMEFAAGKLRVEATLRGMWLRDHKFAVGRAWGPGAAAHWLDERIGGLELSDTMKLTDEYVGEIPGKLALVYDAWRAGRDLRSMYSKAQFYRLRAKLLPYGIDIAHVRPHEVVTENQYLLGAPLKSFLQGGGVPVPDWAIGTSLYVGAV
jgi:II/X family phage/plasmid replication protein